MPLLRPSKSASSSGESASSASSARASDALSPHPSNNVPLHIAEKLGRNLHLQPDHPLSLIRTLIEDYWQRRHASLPGGPAPPFRCESDLHPIVNTRQCFDDLLIAPEHVSRRPSDTYYVDDERVLRTHTSAHQSTLLALKCRGRGLGIRRFDARWKGRAVLVKDAAHDWILRC